MDHAVDLQLTVHSSRKSQGGIEAQNAWPRLAEYFARFQLSSDLPCSLEVLAPTLSRRPLMIRPPTEMERRGRKRVVPLDVDSLVDANNVDVNEGDVNAAYKQDWDGDDGFVEDGVPNNDENNNRGSQNSVATPPPISKAAKERQRIEEERNKRISLMCKAARAFKGRPVSVSNVAHESHPIRRHVGSSGQQSVVAENGPVLEISMVVFGPEPDDDSSDEEGCCGRYPEAAARPQNNCRRSSNAANSAKLQVVRMVNGIPLLDSPEAVACGVVQKISNNNSTWNSFGLDVSWTKGDNGTKENQPSNDTLTFDVNDSAQVAPFFRHSTHALFQERQDYSESSSDDNDFDPDTVTKKRKKERNVTSLRPAALRLGDILMVVQIRAKPSALPLPTLSKVCDAHLYFCL